MIITLNGTKKEVNGPIKLQDLLVANEKKKYQAAKVNNRIRELGYVLNNDAEVEFLDLTDSDACRIYQSTLRYLIVMAAKELYPNCRIIFNYSISRSIFATITNLNRPFTKKDLSAIEERLKAIIEADMPIIRKTITKDEALALYEKQGYIDKVKVLKYRPEETVHIYECGDYKNYMFGYMLPSTGYISEYILRLYTPGFLIQYPRSETGGKIPKFEDAPVFTNALREANNWGNIIEASYISQMNNLVESKEALEFINVCETKHNNMLAELGENIKKTIDDIKLIAVAGPSSSGKTTFTNRLRIELMSRGIKPLMISIDDYYLGLDKAPKDEHGKPDLEHIDALDRELFNEHMYRLIQGEEVTLPHFNFETSSREVGKTVKLGKNQPIMIEGIHALNDELTPSIPSHQKYRIYIAPQAQLHIDDQNPISISDIRLIRRMVRDHNYRNYDCEKTLAIWPSVRRGEFRWIYPHQEKADYVFNSELTYELCVMKKYALPLLERIDSASPHYITANRLIKFLKYFKDIKDRWVPCNSLLREFIGDSIFYTDDLE